MNLVVLIVLIVGFTAAVSVRTRSRIRANENMLHALDVMFDKLDTLMDAKLKFDDDVPDDVMELANWIVENARKPRMPLYLALVILNNGSSRTQLRKPKLRPEIEGVMRDLVHAWVSYTSNRNLFIRLIIRHALGRMLEKDDNASPFGAWLPTGVVHRDGHHLGCHVV